MGVIGAILGDVAGSPYEFQFDAYSVGIRRANNYEFFDSPKYFATDDSIMSIACMKACETDMDFAKHYREIGRKHPADYGSHFLAWLITPEMGPYNSFGNGSAMRASYCGEKFPLEGPGMTAGEAAKLSAECTHNHPEGVKGAVVLATCVAMAKAGKSKEEILAYGIEQYPKSRYKYGCNRPYKDYYRKMQYEISCQGSVPVAIRCFYESENFEDCMRMINAMVCDTDTVGAIAGAICEEYYGKCMASKQQDIALVKKYVPKDLLEILEEYGKLNENEIEMDEMEDLD